MIITKKCRSIYAFVMVLAVIFTGSMMPAMAEIAFPNLSPALAESSLALGNNMSNLMERNNSSAINNESIKAAILKLPLSFIENRGQSPEVVEFVVKTFGQTVFFTPSEVVFSLSGGDNSSVVRMAFEGSEPVEMAGEDLLSGKANFFIGNDSAGWATDIPTYGAIRYKDLYPGVDLVFKGKEGYLKHELVVSPGADPAQIVMTYSGQDNLSLTEDGSVQLRTAAGNLTDSAPVCYQEIDGQRDMVEGSFRLAGANKIGFEVGDYDQSHPLVIDPALVYSTYLGGSVEDVGYGIAIDVSGKAYITGYTASANFPTKNPMQASNAGYIDAFVAKIDADGSALIYSTYLGGSGEDAGDGITVDGSGNVYITGNTNSDNFPTKNPMHASNAGSNDAFVAKINAAGSALVYSTYLGGSGWDVGYGIAVDGSRSAYITGETSSADLPTKNPMQASFAGYIDAFVAKIDADGSALVYSTYLGGSGGDVGYGIAVDGSGNAYINGNTDSSNFPTKYPIQASNAGSDDAFVAKINAVGSALVYSTYLGGSGSDYGRGIVVDSSGNAYITGETISANFPIKNPIQASIGFAGVSDPFVAKIDADGSALVYSTYLGGSGRDYGKGIAVDGSGNAYITGETISANFPTKNPIQASFAGYIDAFIAKIDADGSALVYSTYLGESGHDYVRGIAVDGSGNAYITGNTNSDNFPTKDPIQASNAGVYDAFVAVLSSSDLLPSISLIKMTNGEDANSEPGLLIPVGDAVTWTYRITNNGNVDITNIQVSDNILGPIGTIPLLSPGQSQVLTATGVASAGQYSNLGRAKGSTPSGSTVSAEDSSHYYGESASPIIDIDETASEKWIDPYSSNTDDKEAEIWYEIAPDDFSGQLEIEIKDKNDGEPWTVGPTDVAGGRHSLTWDGRIANEYVNQANNPYYITLVLKEDEKEVARSANQRIWVGRPVILLHGIFSSKEEIEKTDLYDELSRSFYTCSVEYDGGIIGSSTGDIKQYAGKLSNEVDSIKQDTCAKKIDIVAHSMGGLVARYYVQMSEMGETDVGKLIMIGTPNHGADFANLPKATLKALINLILDELGLSSLGYSIDFIVDQVTSNYAINEMIPHHTFIKNLNSNDCCASKIMNDEECSDKISAACQYTVITSEPTWVPTLTHMHSKINIFGYDPLNVFWVTAGDGVVPFFSAELSDVSISSEGTSFHPNQVNSQNIITKVKSILQQPTQLAQYDHTSFDENELDANSTPAYWTNPIEDVIHLGYERSYNISVDQSSIRAHFMLVWDNGTLNVTLLSPNGSEIEMPSNGNVAYYSVQNPDPGNWTAEILSTSIPANGTNVTIQAFIENPLFIGVNTDKTVFDPQEPINITAYVGDNQSGFTGAFVVASVSKPDNRTETLTLYDDGLHNDNGTADGIYANQYMNTSLWGTYRISISASGNLHGNDFKRQIITTVWVELYPDLTLNNSDIHFSNTSPISGENISITAEIRNIGDTDAGNSSILFYDNDPSSGVLIGEDVINISNGSTEKAEAVWEATPGQHEIYVWISPYNSFFELNYSNNMANKSIYVNNPYISGTKFNDSNSNATRDPGEAGLSGWTIKLTRPDGTSINATTDANGGYNFENLTSGTYKVSEVRQDNWTQTYPAWLGDHIVNVTDGNVTGVDFGNNYLPVPDIPFPPAGPASGIPGAEYSYSTSSTDPSGYQIAYIFDWGDGTNTTTGLFDSGATASAAHIWNSSGVYMVRAKATNSKGASSEWSSELEVTIEEGDIPDKIGIFRNGGLYFDANGDGYWSAGDTTGWFGATGDLPIAGDWDGNGRDEIAVFRNGGLYFDADGDGYWSAGDTTGWFGATGDLPAAGDWDGDGRDEIAVFRNGGWYFDANGDGYWSAGDTTGWFGASGDLPAAGDWDGDGRDEIAVFRNGGLYFDADGDGYWSAGDTTGWFGASGDLPAAGDWDGDGKDEIAVFRNGGWYFDANGDGYWTEGDTTGWFGAGGDRPVAGRWGLLSSLALDHDKPQLDLKEQPAEKIRQKRAALEELQEKSEGQVREIKISQEARQ